MQELAWSLEQDRVLFKEAAPQWWSGSSRPLISFLPVPTCLLLPWLSSSLCLLMLCFSSVKMGTNYIKSMKWLREEANAPFPRNPPVPWWAMIHVRLPWCLLLQWTYSWDGIISSVSCLLTAVDMGRECEGKGIQAFEYYLESEKHWTNV